jgi:hypothetical protein
MTASDINHRLYGFPFRPFRVHLTDGAVIPVANARMVLVSKSSMSLPLRFGKDSNGWPLVKQWRAVALAHMVQLSDIGQPVTAKRPKKRG